MSAGIIFDARDVAISRELKPRVGLGVAPRSRHAVCGLGDAGQGINAADCFLVEIHNLLRSFLIGHHGNVDDQDVTRAIRTPEIDRGAAAVARLPKVRAILVERQRHLGAGGGIVMEGRDIGTVVFPAAEVKIYLDAAPEERARRRASDPARSGPTAVAEVVTELAARDEIDRTRAISPLLAAPDAVVIDTTGKLADSVVAEVLAIAQRRSL